MKTIKVSIQDQNTLILLEDAQRGDLIDLKSIHELDIDKSTLDNIIKSIKTEEFNSQLEAAKLGIEKEKNFDYKIREREMLDKAKDDLNKKDQVITSLNTKLETIAKQTESEAKVKTLEETQRIEAEYRKIVSDKEAEIQEVIHQKDLSDQKLKSAESALVSFKEMRSRMSTKMIGESLEIHCENEFNKIRAMAFPNAEFYKDNTVSSTGSKGDYIYREKDDDGIEVLSIMFEMKNEDETTATKHKNKDFLKELDKDRIEKGCEYAVLVSLLEKENEYFDDIVPAHDYPKMYAIRPQHFITIIGFLRQGNIKTQELKRKILELRNRNIDVTNFESNLNAFKEGFASNYNLASGQFTLAIEEIDKTIDHLNKVKDNLLKSDRNLRIANNKATDLSIRRLTANSPSVAKTFEEHSNTNVVVNLNEI